MKPEERMLIIAVRYALGRMSYVVSDTCRFVANVKNKLSIECLNIIIRDIEEAINFCHAVGCSCGTQRDEKDWNNLLNILKLPKEEQ